MQTCTLIFILSSSVLFTLSNNFPLNIFVAVFIKVVAHETFDASPCPNFEQLIFLSELGQTFTKR